MISDHLLANPELIEASVSKLLKEYLADTVKVMYLELPPLQRNVIHAVHGQFKFEELSTEELTCVYNSCRATLVLNKKADQQIVNSKDIKK